LKHVEPVGHPERVKRLEKVIDVLKLSIFNDLTWKEAPLAKKRANCSLSLE
jgi:cAMP phosphodiesterase